MKIKYKITGPFGASPIGKIIDAILLNQDEDSGVGLCFHPPQKDECGSFEFVKKFGKYWVSAFESDIYSNIGILDPSFKKFLIRKQK